MALITKLAAAGIGYVLGARAGQDRYRQIVRLSRQAADSPQLQAVLARLRDLPALASREPRTAAPSAPAPTGRGTTPSGPAPTDTTATTATAGGTAGTAPDAVPALPLTGRRLRRSMKPPAGPAGTTTTTATDDLGTPPPLATPVLDLRAGR